MPELILPCGHKEYVCTTISVEMYRRYTEIMERNDSDSIRDAFEEADPEDVLSAVKEIHFMMQDVITKKFLDLNPEHPEKIQKEKSAFDEYDEENGYNDEDPGENLWKICRENVDRIVKICINLMKNSYQQCMEADIMSLLDHAAFEIRTVDEK